MSPRGPSCPIDHTAHYSPRDTTSIFSICRPAGDPLTLKEVMCSFRCTRAPRLPLPPGIAGPAQTSLGSRGCEVAPHEAERANLSAQVHVTKSPPRDRSALLAEVAPARAQCLGRADKLLRKTDPKGREKGCRWGCWRIPPLQHLSSSHVSMNGTTVRTENGPPSGATVLFEPLRLLHFSVKSPHHPAHIMCGRNTGAPVSQGPGDTAAAEGGAGLPCTDKLPCPPLSLNIYRKTVE